MGRCTGWMSTYVHLFDSFWCQLRAGLHHGRKRGSVKPIATHIYNRFPVLQISMFRSSSQDLVAASGQRRPAKPSGALCIMQSTTTCCTDCVMCPQAHETDSWTPQSFNVSPTRAVPQRRRFSFTHCLRRRSVPGGSAGLCWGQAVRMRGGPLSTRSLHALSGS